MTHTFAIRPLGDPNGEKDAAAMEAFMRQEQAGMEIPDWDYMNRFVERWDEMYDRNVISLAAFIDDEMVGICFIVPGKKSSNKHIGTLRLDVVAEHRHEGIGPKLLAEALKQADEAGILRVTATPYDRFDKDANAALVFFSGQGFRLEGKARHGARLANGDLVDTWLMARVKE